MNFFALRTNDQDYIGDILNAKYGDIKAFSRLNRHKDIIKIGDVVFIVLGGDKADKQYEYSNGLLLIGRVTKEPYDFADKYFTIEYEVLINLSADGILTKKMFSQYPLMLDVPHMGPATKGAADQALAKISDESDNTLGYEVLKAIADLVPALKEKIAEYFSIENFELQKYMIVQSSILQKIFKLQKKSQASENSQEKIPLNILFKGVPGTGKSRKCDILAKKLNAELNTERFLRINIHSSTANSDLMQGIGVYTHENNIIYAEKTGVVMDFIKKAVLSPFENFVLVLEEIQENSLNMLIGDLIYLIEEAKRTDVSLVYETLKSTSSEDFFVLSEKIIQASKESHSVTIPYLIENKPIFRKMILPRNLYIFCTSNYRDDKKIIEDNLMRRFTVAEIYPNNDAVNDSKIKTFFEKLNKSILEHMQEFETHPDRFMVGHDTWMQVSSEDEFHRAFLKMVIDFKDIKEVEFNDFMEIIQKLDFASLEFEHPINIEQAKNYKELIDMLQQAGLPWLTD